MMGHIGNLQLLRKLKTASVKNCFIQNQFIPKAQLMLHGLVINSNKKTFGCYFADGNSIICMEEKSTTLSQRKRSHF